jgi:hypothetical protein
MIEEEARRSYSEDPGFYSLDPYGDELGEEWLENELAYQAQLEAGDDLWV